MIENKIFLLDHFNKMKCHCGNNLVCLNSKRHLTCTSEHYVCTDNLCIGLISSYIFRIDYNNHFFIFNKADDNIFVDNLNSYNFYFNPYKNNKIFSSQEIINKIEKLGLIQ